MLFLLVLPLAVHAQTAADLLAKIKAKLDKVKDYEASGTMKMNVTFVKVPVATVKVYYKNPDKLRIKNESGISLVPKGSINISLNKIVDISSDCDIIDVGKEDKTGWRIIKLLPKSETADIVLSTLYIDDKQFLIKKAKTTTKENGTYDLEMSYGKYAEYGLADKIIFSFNTREYKLPKGVTFDYDDGSKKPSGTSKTADNKGTVEISYSNYSINKGVPDSVFL
jgi:outer membrane lipoprotein-sorting protein